jgi:hypothetical protein
MALTFLTPRLPPCVCGVGDHTAHMAEALRGLVPAVTALVLHPCPQQGHDVFDRIDVWDKSPTKLSRLLREHATDVLWIQYSGYGFGYQGAPRYLVRAVEALRPRPKIVVYFHEIHCAPHQLGWKGLVLSPLQKQIGKALAGSADKVFVSNELYRQTIQCDYSVPSNRVAMLPLGSNIPVPAFTTNERLAWRNELGWSKSDRVAVAFGSAGGQRKALERNRKWLLAALDAGVVSHVISIGGEPGTCRDDVLPDENQRIAQASIVTGHQPPERVASTLVAADVALMGYPFERFGKSGVFMAYSLAGLPIVVGEDLPASVSTFRGARLVRSSDIKQLTAVMADVDSRIARQRQAAEKFSWSSLARSAMNAMSSVSPAIHELRTAAGVAR